MLATSLSYERVYRADENPKIHVLGSKSGPITIFGLDTVEERFFIPSTFLRLEMSSFAFVCTGRLLIVVLVLLLSISVKGEEAASTSIESDQGATRTKKALGLKGMVLEAKEKLAEEHKQSKKRPKSLRHPKVQQGGLLPSMDRNSNYTSGGSPGSWIHSQASVHTCGVRGVTKNGTVVTRYVIDPSCLQYSMRSSA